MKTAQICIFLGVLLTGVLNGRAPLRAQPASNETPADRAPDAPKGSVDPTGDETTQSDDDPIVTDDDDNKPWSQGVSAENRKVARKLFLEGNRFFRIPLFAKAAEQYNAALGKWKHPAFYFNLALAQLNLGKEIEARENLERALQYGADPLGAEQFHEAQKQLQELKRHLGRIRVTCRTPGAEVTMDGMTLFIGPGSYEGWATAKSHELTAKKVGYLADARRVAITPEVRQDIELKLLTLDQATDSSRRWSAWKPWAVVAAGGVIAIAGGGLHALSARNFNDYDGRFLTLDCVTPHPETPGCTKDDISSDLDRKLNLARQQQTFAVGAYIASGTVLATGIVLLYLNRPQFAEKGARSMSARSVAIIPTISGDMRGLVMSVRH